jgi:hypothetical protein
MLSLQDGRGFCITFPNGWTASVKWGYGSYCDNYHAHKQGDNPESSDAEVAAFKGEQWHVFDRTVHDAGTEDEFVSERTTEGWRDPMQVLDFLNEIASKKD